VKIDLAALPIQRIGAYQSAVSQMGQWINHTVKWIDKISLYLQDARLASLALVGMNIVCFQVALSICRFIHYIFKPNASSETISVSESNARALGLGVVFVGTLGFANYTFSKVFHLPITTWKIVLISLSTNVFYLYWKTRT
jgi:hypothetical protein